MTQRGLCHRNYAVAFGALRGKNSEIGFFRFR